jgi:two-component system response regulator YesN
MYRLLLVDDERIIVDSLYSYLREQFDMEIDRVYSAFAALGLLKQRRFDIVVTDINMPGMDGLELLAYIKKHWPACGVIMLTGYDDFSYAYQASQFKDTDFILKVEPYSTVRKAIENRLAALEQNRRDTALFESLGDRLAQMLPLIRRDTLDRLLRYGDALPGREDLDQMGLALDPDEPVLLGVSEFSSAAEKAGQSYERQQRVAMMVEQRMRERGLTCISHPHEPGIAWLIQTGVDTRNEPVEDLVEYVREILFDMPGQLEGIRDEGESFAICDRFVAMADIPAAYAAARARLLHLQGGGVSVVKLTAAPEDTVMAFPSMATLDRLALLYRQGARDDFLQEATAYIAPLCQPGGLAPHHPNPILSGMCTLFCELLQSLGLHQWPDSRYTRVLAGVGYESGEQWQQDALRLFDAVFDLRQDEQQRQRGWLVEEINAYLNAHYMEDLSLGSLARHVHYNPSYLSRVYREATGKKLMGCLMDVRIDQAKHQLLHTTAKISDIAKSCGFFSTKYFNQAFKRETGTTPAAYRQQASGEPSN